MIQPDLAVAAAAAALALQCSALWSSRKWLALEPGLTGRRLVFLVAPLSLAVGVARGLGTELSDAQGLAFALLACCVGASAAGTGSTAGFRGGGRTSARFLSRELATTGLTGLTTTALLYLYIATGNVSPRLLAMALSTATISALIEHADLGTESIRWRAANAATSMAFLGGEILM